MDNLVTTAKGATTGAVRIGDPDAVLPTTTDSAATGFDDLGHISEEGFKTSGEKENFEIRDWNGDVVYTETVKTTHTVKFTLIDALSDIVQKFVNGEKNVTGTLEEGMTVKETSDELEMHSMIVDMILVAGIKLRKVYPKIKIQSVDEIEYRRGAGVAYAVTALAMKDDAGCSCYNYYKK